MHSRAQFSTIAAVALLLLTSITATLAADPMQYWFQGGLAGNPAKHFKATAEIQSRLDDHGTFIYEHTDVGFAYTGIAEWLDVSLNYRFVFRKNTDDTWSQETRPHLNATARFRLFNLAFSDRVRLEYNSLDTLGDFGTVRNKLSLNPPVYLEPLRESHLLLGRKVRPFLSYEFFYTTDTEEISKHRFQGGISAAFGDRVFSDLYYMRQEGNGKRDGLDMNVVGLNLKFLF